MRRVELELRRAGGPRRELLKELFEEGERLGAPMWGNYVCEACEKGILDCNDYVEAAERHAKAAQPELRAFIENQLVGVRKEAALQGMSAAGRRVLYERAIKAPSATESGVSIYDTEAAQRAMREGFFDLIPAIRRRMSDWSAVEREAVGPYLAVGKALSGRDPAGALVELVRRGAESPIKGAAPGVGKASPAHGVPGRTGVLALGELGELRRLAPPDAYDDLKDVLELYDRAGPVGQKRMPASPVRGSSTSAAGSALASLGELGWEIAETIGDLGNRDYERGALGGRTLWDQVNEAEKELVRQGKLRQSEMVSQ